MGVLTGKGTLTEEQVQTFDRDGLVVIDPPWRAGLLDELTEEFEARFRDDSNPGPEHIQDDAIFYRDREGGDYHWKRILNGWRISKAARDVALEPYVLSTLERLFGRPPVPFQTLNFPVGTQQRPHSDAMFFSSKPDGFMCGVWVALEDVDMDSGPLVYYPTSHKLPFPSNASVEREMGEEADQGLPTPELRKERDRLFGAYCQKMISDHGLEPSYATVKKGQAVIWAANLLHGGAAQRDLSRTRRSQVTHYLFEGTRLHRPIWSEGDLVFWDYPHRVRDPVPQFSVDALRAAVADNVPAGSTVLVTTRGDRALLDLPGFEVRPFPRDDQGEYREPREGDDAIASLEEERALGAQFAVFPPGGIGALLHDVPELHQLLEAHYPLTFADGDLCVIYDLT